MKKIIWIISCVFITSTLCSQGLMNEEFLTSKSGLLYKIIPSKGTDTLKVGHIVQYTLVQKFGDSLIRNSEESGNGFAKIDSLDQPFAETEIMKMMQVGDSAFIKIRTDSIYAFIKKQAEQDPSFSLTDFEKNIPSFFLRKNDFVTLNIRVLKKYIQDSDAQADFEKEKPKMEAYQRKMQEKAMKEQAEKDAVGFKEADKVFKAFMVNKMAKCKKTPSGAYVEIIKQGTGALCSKGATAKVRYRGTLLNGTEFDYNIKKPGEPVKPTYDVVVGQGGSIVGFAEGVAALRKGSKAIVYIPTKLGYGGQGSGMIQPYDNIKFELEIEDVIPAKQPVKTSTSTKPKVPLKKAPVKKPIKK